MENINKYSFREAREAKKAKDLDKTESIYTKLYNQCPDQFKPIDKDNFSYVLYMNHIRGNVNNDSIKYAEIITNLVSQKNTNTVSYCSYTLTVLAIMKYFKENNKFKELMKWGSLLNPKFLNAKPFKRYDGKLSPSSREKWYSYMTKASLELNALSICIKFSIEALESLELVYGHWFKWRLSRVYFLKEDYDNVLLYLKDVEPIVKTGYVYNLFAQSYYNKGDLNNSLKYTINAILTKDEINKKLGSYKLIIKLLEEKGIKDNILKHKYLIYGINTAMGYNNYIDSSLKNQFIEAGFDIENPDYIAIEKELRKYWLSLKYIDQELSTGVVTKILSNGFSGFIRKDIKGLYTGDSSETLYFNMRSVNCNPNLIKEGTQVSFYLKEGFDKKRNEVKMNAIEIDIN